MATAESVKEKILGLIDQSNAATGNADADLTAAVGSLIAGFDQGSDGLNYRIIGGTTQPASPAENTIWVSTGTDIAGYVLTPEAPADLYAGLLWVKTGSAGMASFNALKNNMLQVSVSDCKQYLSEKLSPMDGYIYQNGEWIRISSVWDGTLFDAGNQYEEYTGGWKHSSVSSIGTTISGYSGSTTSWGSYAYTVNPIDLTDWNTINVNFTAASNNGGSIVANTVAGLGTAGSMPGFIKITAQGVGTLDISHLSGEHYILLAAGPSQGSFTADKVWLA